MRCRAVAFVLVIWAGADDAAAACPLAEAGRRMRQAEVNLGYFGLWEGLDDRESAVELGRAIGRWREVVRSLEGPDCASDPDAAGLRGRAAHDLGWAYRVRRQAFGRMDR
jgi:hypothetical protein